VALSPVGVAGWVYSLQAEGLFVCHIGSLDSSGKRHDDYDDGGKGYH
jgi:hypothetical protein